VKIDFQLNIGQTSIINLCDPITIVSHSKRNISSVASSSISINVSCC